MRSSATFTSRKRGKTMIKAGGNYEYKAKFVKHRPYDGRDITSFSIGDKIKGSDNQWQNYQFTVWEYVPIKNDDKVKIVSIDSISANYYNGKIYYNLSGKVEIVVPDVKQFAEENAPATKHYQQAQQAQVTPQAFADESKPAWEAPGDEDTTLPFDI